MAGSPDRVVELERRIDELEGEIERLEPAIDLLRENSEGDKEELSQQLAAQVEQLRDWISIADSLGERADGAAYWWTHAPVRGCGTDVLGPPPEPSNMHVEAGPLFLRYALEHERSPAEEFEPVEEGKYWGTKFLLEVSEGRRVLLLVPSDGRENASLFYQTYRINDPQRPTTGGVPLAVSQGEPAVVFEACPSGARNQPTQFDGAIVVGGPRCVGLEVYFDGSVDKQEVNIGFGTECSS